MRSKRSPLVVVGIAAALIYSASGSVSAAHPSQRSFENCRYFTESAHYVCGEFLEYFETRGGVEIFSFPLTEAFDDPSLGRRVQYFQRTRMEYHPDNPDPYQVLLGLLVDELGYRFPPARPEQIPAFNSALHHYFSETRHAVSYGFLDYYREKGGLDIFGYPRSEFMYEDGYIVQYFQRARMEWHPEDSSGPQMRLTNLGETYIERFGVPGDYDKPRHPPPRIIDDNPAIPTLPPEPIVAKLNTSASVRHVITGREGTQTVFVYVTDQWQQPVQGADVKMMVYYQSGDKLYEFDPTNASGFTNRSFEISPVPLGRKVVIDVAVTYIDLTGTTQTFFLPWW